jgi:lipoprotein signal peptidase
VTVGAGATASFSAAASGSPTPTVQWRVSTNNGASFSNISGATSTTYSFTATSGENGYRYEAVFTNFFASATTNAATLTVTGQSGTGPSITLQPVSQTVTAGSGVSFSAAASGSPTPTVQWKVSTNNGTSFSNITNATSTTYSFTATSGENGYEYEAVFTISANSATTNPATLTVTATSSPTPSITLQPVSQTVTAGSGVSFSAAASGSPTPTVQWKVSTNNGTSFSNITNATSTTYSFTATSGENGYEYEAVFTISANSATTNPATLTVTATSSPAPAPQQSSNWSGYVDVDATFTAVSASWTVPTITCTRGQTAYSAHWIGIDGDTSGTVEQDGTEADCISGSPSYDAWYEMYGDNAVDSGYEVELSPSTNPVSHGDSMSASVSVSNNDWTLSITDSSQGWSYTTPAISFSAAQSSAEWVVERPEVCSPRCAAHLAGQLRDRHLLECVGYRRLDRVDRRLFRRGHRDGERLDRARPPERPYGFGLQRHLEGSLITESP